jgi:hypothetical protein
MFELLFKLMNSRIAMEMYTLEAVPGDSSLGTEHSLVGTVATRRIVSGKPALTAATHFYPRH